MRNVVKCVCLCVPFTADSSGLPGNTITTETSDLISGREGETGREKERRREGGRRRGGEGE